VAATMLPAPGPGYMGNCWERLVLVEAFHGTNCAGEVRDATLLTYFLFMFGFCFQGYPCGSLPYRFHSQTRVQESDLTLFRFLDLFQPLNRSMVDVASVQLFNPFLLLFTRLIWLGIGEEIAAEVTRD